ncbi:hypothetical protein [Paracidovorax oryzae]|uniref:hypothetical protein n=1 Tax=Paracidovorax oryzae TaxID=862720 RepID=UPI0012FEBA11|nr:hypothetical protein [Paracidovorax oryzae]
MIVLNTVADAISHLEFLASQEPGYPADTDIRFEGELKGIRIDIEGREFHGSITGELSRGLAGYQDEIYKAAKYAIYGKEGRIQLTADQRAAFELVFEVREGSTDLMAPVNTIAEGLKEALTTMEPTLLAVVIIGVVLILTTAAVATKIHAAIQVTKQKELDGKVPVDTIKAMGEHQAKMAEHQAKMAEQQAKSAEQQAKIAEQHIKFLETVAKSSSATVERFGKAQEEGIKSVLRSVPTAEAVKFTGVPFDSDDVRELKRRARRGKAEYVEVVGNFRIFADTNVNPVKLTLAGADLPGEFSVDWPLEIESSKEDWLWSAIRNKTVIPLEVSATIIRDEVRTGAILDVLASVPLPPRATSDN